MTRDRSSRLLLAVLLVCLIPSTVVAAPTPPGGSEPPSDRDPCENVGKYLNDDYDRDGLSGYQECQFGSNPEDFDSDNDYLGDDKELQAGTDPNVQDTDGDQLWDCWEFSAATNGGVPTEPLSVGLDTDGDGIADDLEVYYGLNPGAFDTDQDMLWDGEEFLPMMDCGSYDGWALEKASFALDSDSDDDGLDDGVEVKSLGTYPHNPDSDFDGYSDGDEVLKWGTDPHDPNDPSTSNPPDYHP